MLTKSSIRELACPAQNFPSPARSDGQVYLLALALFSSAFLALHSMELKLETQLILTKILTLSIELKLSNSSKTITTLPKHNLGIPYYQMAAHAFPSLLAPTPHSDT